MNQMQFQLEVAAFDEKRALAELEEAKAHERVKELEYEQARFKMQWLTHVAQIQEKAQQQPTPAS